MNFLQIDNCSTCDGTGIRVVLWVSGCTQKCKGCHNPESWNFNAGELFGSSAKNELLDDLQKEWISGVTISGGHPLEDQNLYDVNELIKEIRNQLPNKTIWLYTGYTLTIHNFIQLDSFEPFRDSMIRAITTNCDVIVDGPYIDSLRDVTLQFRGSSNQRIIDVQSTLKEGEIVLWNK